MDQAKCIWMPKDWKWKVVRGVKNQHCKFSLINVNSTIHLEKLHNDHTCNHTILTSEKSVDYGGMIHDPI
jgi:hypothetical protein